MLVIKPEHYQTVKNLVDNEYRILDHLNGFDMHLSNRLLSDLDRWSQDNKTIVHTEYILDDSIRDRYPNLSLRFDLETFGESHFSPTMLKYTQHPELNFKNFLCTFNVKPHVSRQLLVSMLDRFDLFDRSISTKHFSFEIQRLNDHIRYLSGSEDRLYNKFFSRSVEFATSEIKPDVYKGRPNLAPIPEDMDFLVPRISTCFLHLVSETVAETYIPFVTEKFLFSVISRGLFVSWAQPGWHKLLSQKLGFRLYDRIFDYDFDSVQNPIKRLLTLTMMINKFRHLDSRDWHDLWLIEKDNIEYNYEHYFSGDYLKKVEKYA